MYNSFAHTKVKDLVNQNYLIASVLYYFGVKIKDYKDFTFEDLCHKKGISTAAVIKEIDALDELTPHAYQHIFNQPLLVVLAYLKYSHKNFIKYRLPYIAKLIDEASDSNFKNRSLLNDLKMIFPLFMEDFIKHIYDEEATLFNYVQLLLENKQLSDHTYIKLIWEMEHNSLQTYLDQHIDEDEMKGIRELTKNFKCTDNSPLYERVVIAELKGFSHDLKRHALIENDVLIPLAIEHEQLLKEKVASKIPLN